MSILPASRKHTLQRGAATLLMSMALLLSTSVVMLYLNRQIIFEQRMSADQLRSGVAFEAAEAGLEWVTGLLNMPQSTGAICPIVSTETGTFRSKSIHFTPEEAANIDPAASNTQQFKISVNRHAMPGCSFDKDRWSCWCPAGPDSTEGPSPGAAAANVLAALPGFTAAFLPTGELDAVQLLVTGCAAVAGPCTPSNAAGVDASAAIAVTLKMLPLLRSLPVAAITCGGACSLSADYRVINQDYAAAGILVHSGGEIEDQPGTHYVTLAGQALSNAKLAQDARLKNISSKDSDCAQALMFQSYFGLTLQEFATTTNTMNLGHCQTAGVCDTLVDTAYAAGWRSFFFSDGYTRLSTTTLGTAMDPVLLVGTSAISATPQPAAANPANSSGSGPLSPAIFGLVFVNGAMDSRPGSGSMHLRGAMMACGHFDGNGSGLLEYDAQVLLRLRDSTALMVRVPGSWTDLCSANDTLPLALVCTGA